MQFTFISPEIKELHLAKINKALVRKGLFAQE